MHRSPAHLVAFVALALALALSVACAGPPSFPLPQTAVERLEPFDVVQPTKRIWKERFDFGPWHAHNVDRGWTKSMASYFAIEGEPWTIVFRNWKVFAIEGRHWAWRFGSVDESQRPDVVRDYSFNLNTDGELSWGVQCGQELRFDSEALTCALRNEESEKVWILALSNQGAAEPAADWLDNLEKDIMTGTLSDGTTSWDMAETFRLENLPIASLEDPTGYYFLRDGRIAGAVELFGDGRVWLDDSGPDEPRAAAAAALLLYRSLRAEHDDRA
ncbi:MAG: hypothetical protein AAGC60_30590 [Acidobacteriota bacterium]